MQFLPTSGRNSEKTIKNVKKNNIPQKIDLSKI